MPTVIRGDRLLPATRQEVLAAFGYRWTVENEKNARAFGDTRTPSATQTDAEWLRASAFYVNADGSFASEMHIQPDAVSICTASLAPDPPCACCRFTLRPQDHANPIPGTATFRCDMCAHGWGACCEERRS